MDFSKYENKMEYPKRPIKPHCRPKASSKEVIEYAKNLEKWEDLMEKYKEALRLYREENLRLQKMFKHDILEENRILNHPKADRVYELAWERGHAFGFTEVAREVEDLADLVKP